MGSKRSLAATRDQRICDSDVTPKKHSNDAGCAEPDRHSDDDWLEDSLPYIVPYGLYVVMTVGGDYLPGWTGTVYALKTLIVAAALWHYRKEYTELRFRLTAATPVAVIIGVLVIVAWVGLDTYYPQSWAEWRELLHGGVQEFGHEAKAEGAFDPFAGQFAMPPILAVVFRVAGAVLVVPIFEELFIRSWLLRLLIKSDFRSVPTGAFTWFSFVGTVALFGLAHHEWLAAAICGLLFNLLLYWKKDLFQCVVAHAVANLALALWVLTQGAWHFW